MHDALRHKAWSTDGNCQACPTSATATWAVLMNIFHTFQRYTLPHPACYLLYTGVQRPAHGRAWSSAEISACGRARPTSALALHVYIVFGGTSLSVQLATWASRYDSLTCTSLQAYVYDWLLSISEECEILSKSGMTPSNALYLVSRYVLPIHWHPKSELTNALCILQHRSTWPCPHQCALCL